MSAADRLRLAALLAERSAKRGQFTLASGRVSNFYVDARLTTMSPEGLALIGPAALEAIADAHWDVDSVGGLTLGADPISYAISYASASTVRPVRAFTVRKEPNAADRVALSTSRRPIRPPRTSHWRWPLRR